MRRARKQSAAGTCVVVLVHIGIAVVVYRLMAFGKNIPGLAARAALGLALFAVMIAGAAAQDVVVKRFIGGSGMHAVGIIDASEDVEITGPQALTTGENGDLFLLDQVNSRIIRFNPKESAADPRLLGLPEDIRPTDLIVRKD